MGTELTMNELIRGKASRRPGTGASPDAVIAAVAELVQSLPATEVELFRDQIFSALYPESDSAGATS